MKLLLVKTAFFLIMVQYAQGQNTFFIGEKTYPCTKSFTLWPKEYGGNELDVLIAKNGQDGMIALSVGGLMSPIRVLGKVIIYLEDGSVITCIDREKYDYVDHIATTIYYLTREELTKMKNSNISSIRYSLKCFDCQMSTEEGNFSANNHEESFIFKHEKTNVPEFIRGLFGD